MPGRQQQVSPHGGPAAHQTQEHGQIAACPEIVRIRVRFAAERPEATRFRCVDVRLDAGLAASDELQVPDGQRAESDGDSLVGGGGGVGLIYYLE